MYRSMRSHLVLATHGIGFVHLIRGPIQGYHKRTIRAQGALFGRLCWLVFKLAVGVISVYP